MNSSCHLSSSRNKLEKSDSHECETGKQLLFQEGGVESHNSKTDAVDTVKVANHLD